MAKTYTTKELADLAGVQPRTIRSYSFEKVLTKPEFRGKRTAYTEQNLAEVLAFRALVKDMDSWDAKAAMRKMTPGQLREKAGLVVSPPPQPAPAPVPSPPAAKPASPDPPVALGEDWSRVALLPGLELHVRSDAKDFVRRVAREIREKYASS